jgi:adenylosuccinate lyase
MTHETYHNPLGARYASKEMGRLFSDNYKYALWRKLWVALAKGEKQLGLSISDEQIQELETHIETIDFERVASYEKKLRHDVMAHLHAYADQCPAAKPIIHLGATSCFVTDNADLIQMREGLRLIQHKLVSVIRELSTFAQCHQNLPCLAYTHFQAAQPTTVGKRACLWIQDYLNDLQDLEYRLEKWPFLGVKGATGTQASFLNLFEGDQKKVQELEALVAKEMGFSTCLPIAGQTYCRKLDMQLFHVLSGIAASAHKMATDLRLLAHLKEIEEPFDNTQVGSSAMPYKRNPMKSERICSLARFALSLTENPAYTASLQWFERTLDDSANRRLCIPEGFLAVDGILQLLLNLIPGLIVYPKVIEKHLKEELPFLLTEEILMEGVKKGGDRQHLHERLRVHSQQASQAIKEEGKPNDLLDRILSDSVFQLTKTDTQTLLKNSRLTGMASEQVAAFINECVFPAIEKYGNFMTNPVDIDV